MGARFKVESVQGVLPFNSYKDGAAFPQILLVSMGLVGVRCQGMGDTIEAWFRQELIQTSWAYLNLVA